MLVYILPTIFCIFGIYKFDYKRHIIGRREFFYSLLWYLVLLSGLSYRVGSDSGFYMDSYDLIPTISKLRIQDFSDSPYQPLYFLLCVICRSITPKIWLMHLIQSYIVCFTYFKFIKQNTSYLFTGAFMFMTCMYTYFCYEIYKESLAISMMLLGYKYLPQEKYLKYYIFAFLATMFHFSGVVAMLIPFIRKLKFNGLFFLWVGLLLAILTVFQSVALDIIQGGIFSMNDMLIQKLGYYTFVVTDRYNDNWYIMALLRNVLVPIGTIVYLKKSVKNIDFEWSFVFYILLGIGTLQFALIFDRPINYALPFVVISISEATGQSYKKRSYKVISSLIVCFVFWFACRGWFYAREETWRLMIPYESIFDEKVDMKRENVITNIH